MQEITKHLCNNTSLTQTLPEKNNQLTIPGSLPLVSLNPTKTPTFNRHSTRKEDYNKKKKKKETLLRHYVFLFYTPPSSTLVSLCPA